MSTSPSPAAKDLYGTTLPHASEPGSPRAREGLGHALAGNTPPAVNAACDTLDPGCIRLLNWNIQKQVSPLWRRDLLRWCHDIDLALFQEVHLDDRFFACFEESWCHSFAKGYTTRTRVTGVLTMANVNHLSHRPHSISEPLLRTPKATNITTYALDGCREPLLVINLHAVNFSLGMRAYERQLRQVVRVLEEHHGPVIFAGDFNTWHPGRERLLRAVATLFNMQEVILEEDHRKRVFGYCLDYVFTRGLRTVRAHTHAVQSSDHNPILAHFCLD